MSSVTTVVVDSPRPFAGLTFESCRIMQNCVEFCWVDLENRCHGYFVQGTDLVGCYITYVLLVQRGNCMHKQVCKSYFPMKQKAGDTDLDLWLDSNIHPRDSPTVKKSKIHMFEKSLRVCRGWETWTTGICQKLGDTWLNRRAYNYNILNKL